MIAHLKGTISVKKPPFLVVDVAGVGYELQCSMTTIYALPSVGNEVLLYTYLVVREDAHLLYGFYDETERLLFRQIIKVSGVGPKLALAILSGMNVASFIQCIKERNTGRLVKLPGVGAKTAERLVIEMQDRLDKQFIAQEFNATVIEANKTDSQLAQQDAVGALTALGYKLHDAQTLVRKIYVADADSETLIRLALQTIVK